MPALSIIIPTKDRGDIFWKTFEQVLKSSSHLDIEILIINNSLTPIIPSTKPANVFIYDNPNNKDSVFSSRNYGASIARSPILLFLDDDILVTKESMDYTLAFHLDHTSACLNVNWVYPPELMEKIRKTIFGRYLIKYGFTAMKSLQGKAYWQDNAPFISPALASFFFGIRKEDFIKISGYDERHLHEGTDVNITNRLHKNNIEIWINPLITVYHNESDRTDIVNWLDRKKRLGEIHGNSVNMHDEGHLLYYSFSKKIGFHFIYFLQPLLLPIIKLFDNIKFDIFGFFLINALLGANMCKGYTSKIHNKII